jgi:hypothetical protein
MLNSIQYRRMILSIKLPLQIIDVLSAARQHLPRMDAHSIQVLKS